MSEWTVMCRSISCMWLIKNAVMSSHLPDPALRTMCSTCPPVHKGIQGQREWRAAHPHWKDGTEIYTSGAGVSHNFCVL